MVVKIENGYGGWVYIEANRVEATNRKQAFKNVKSSKGAVTTELFNVLRWDGNKPVFNESGNYFDEQFMSPETFSDLQKGPDEYALAIVVTVCKEGNTPKIIAVVGEVYLLNDQGKTIERL